jgi:hypothetical protein
MSRAARVHAGVGAALLVAVAARHGLPRAAVRRARFVDAPRGRIWLLGSIGAIPSVGRTPRRSLTRDLSAADACPRRPDGRALPFLAGLASAGDRTPYLRSERAAAEQG